MISALRCRAVRAVRSRASRLIGVLRTATEMSFTDGAGCGQAVRRRKPRRPRRARCQTVPRMRSPRISDDDVFEFMFMMITIVLGLALWIYLDA